MANLKNVLCFTLFLSCFSSATRKISELVISRILGFCEHVCVFVSIVIFSSKIFMPNIYLPVVLQRSNSKRLNLFMYIVEKRPNMVSTPQNFYNYVWPLFNIMHESIKQSTNLPSIVLLLVPCRNNSFRCLINLLKLSSNFFFAACVPRSTLFALSVVESKSILFHYFLRPLIKFTSAK